MKLPSNVCNCECHVCCPQRVSRQVSAGFMEMLREEQAAVEAGEAWGQVSARLQIDPRFQVNHVRKAAFG